MRSFAHPVAGGMIAAFIIDAVERIPEPQRSVLTFVLLGGGF